MRALAIALLLAGGSCGSQAQQGPLQPVVPQVVPPQPAPTPQAVPQQRLVPQLLPTTQAVEIQRLAYGSGTPGEIQADSFEAASVVTAGVYHVPQYMPGYPTSATIWPRVVEVPCFASGEGALRCKGYYVTPATGRGEYLFFHPVLVGAGGPVSAAPEPTPPHVEMAVPVEPERASGSERPQHPKHRRAARERRKQPRN